LKTAIPASAVRLAARSLTPRRRNASAIAEASDASLISSRSRSSAFAAMTAWRRPALSRRSGGYQSAADADRRAVQTIGEALAGSDRPFVIASGTLGLTPGRVATERDGHDPNPASTPLIGGAQTRQATAQMTLSFASRGVRCSVVRLPRRCTAKQITASWRP